MDAAKPLVIALVGTRNVFAHHLLQRLPARPDVAKVVAFDVAPLSGRSSVDDPSVTSYQLDLTLPSSDTQLAAVLGDENVDVVLHLSFLEQPVRDTIWAHELESIGTMHILNACAAAQVKKLVVRSSTVVYGASSRHPNFLDERTPLAEGSKNPFVADKVDAEKQIARFTSWNHHLTTTVLRFSPIVGPHSRDFVIPYLGQMLKLRLMGRDPLVQLLYEDDAIDAMETAIFEEHPGVFNIAPEGVLPLNVMLKATHSRTLALPKRLARRVVNLMWAFEIRTFPPDFLDFLCYLCVADNRKARERMGLVPRYTTREALHLYRQTEAFATHSSLFG